MRCAILALLAALATPAFAAPADVRPWVEANRARLLADYVALLAIPNVAADTPNIRRNADHLVGMMRARGLAPRLLEGTDPAIPPLVYGEWRVPGATRTLVFYAHYDGQPVSPEDWRSTAPFTPTLYTDRLDRGGAKRALPNPGEAIDPDWRLYGRSASDDKAGVMAIVAAVDALKAAGRTPGFNLKIVLEGEEEAGSPHLAALLAKHRPLLASDGWVIVDGPAHPTGADQVVLGVRGIVGAEITVYGPARPLHSGHYGNWAPNPGLRLARLLASMKDDDGRVRVAGFYDDTTPLSAAERAAVAAVPSAEPALRADLGLTRVEGGGRSLVALLHQPSLNIAGLRSADVGDKARNVIPTTATATIDMRLVAGNDAKRQFDRLAAHVRAQGYHVLDREPTIDERRRHPMIARVVNKGGYNAERIAIDHPLAQGVIAAAKTAGPIVVLPTMGGSLPLYLLREVLGAPNVTLALANHDNNQHAEDENLRLGDLWDATATIAAVMTMEPPSSS